MLVVLSDSRASMSSMCLRAVSGWREGEEEARAGGGGIRGVPHGPRSVRGGGGYDGTAPLQEGEEGGGGGWGLAMPSGGGRSGRPDGPRLSRVGSGTESIPFESRGYKHDWAG